jgi:hypothetical protein
MRSRVLMPLIGNDGDLPERVLTYQLMLADAVDRKAIESAFQSTTVSNFHEK